MGKISSSSGLAASPGFSFKDEPNTGLFTEGAGVLGYAVGGTEVMSVSGTTLAFKPNAGMTESLPSNTSNPSNGLARMYWNGSNTRLKIYMQAGSLGWQSLAFGSGTPGTLPRFSSDGKLIDSKISITGDDIVFARVVLAASSSPGYSSAFRFSTGRAVLEYDDVNDEFSVGGSQLSAEESLLFRFEDELRVLDISNISSAEGTGGYSSFSLTGGIFKSASLRFGSGTDKIDGAASQIAFTYDSYPFFYFAAAAIYAYLPTTVDSGSPLSLRCKEIITDNLKFFGTSELYLNFAGGDVVNFHILDAESDSVFKYESSRAKAIINSTVKVNCDISVDNKVSLSDEGIRAYVPLSATDYTCFKREGTDFGFWSSDSGGTWLLKIDSSGDVTINDIETDASVYLKCSYPQSVTVNTSLRFTDLDSGTETLISVIISSGQIVRAFSSRRYKKDIVDLEFDPFKVLELKPTFYTRIDSGRREFGLIAEEVYQVLPQLVVCKHDTGEPEAVKHELLNVLYVSVLKSFDSRFERIEKAFVFRDGAVPFDPSAHMADLRDLQVRQGEIHGRLDVLSDKADEMETALGKLEELVSRN